MRTLSKSCSSCKKSKPAESFHKRSDRPDGLQTSCKDCHKARQRTWVRESEALGELQLSPEQKRQNYFDVIDRMRQFGIMSDKMADAALKRVRDGI